MKRNKTASHVRREVDQVGKDKDKKVLKTIPAPGWVDEHFPHRRDGKGRGKGGNMILEKSELLINFNSQRRREKGSFRNCGRSRPKS